MEENDVTGLANDLDQLISNCERHVNTRLFGNVYDLNFEIGRAQYLIRLLQERLGPDETAQSALKSMTQRVEQLKDHALTIGLQDNPAEKDRRAMAVNFSFALRDRVAANLQRSVKHVMIASGTAMVASLAAMAQAWDKDQFVSVLAWQVMTRYLPALFAAGLAEALYGAADSFEWRFWQGLDSVRTESTKDERDRHIRSSRWLRYIAGICLALGVSTMILGILQTSEQILDLKKSIPSVSAHNPQK